MILLLGDPRDLHVARVARELVKRGQEPIIFSRYDRKSRLSARLVEGRWRFEMLVGRYRFDLDELSAVWWRQKSFSFFAGEPERVEGTELFAEREWYQPIQALPHLLCDTSIRWLNDPRQQIVANLKPVQLGIAARIGLAVPDTLISSDSEDIKRFLSGRPAVYKGFSGLLIGKDQFVFTTPINTEIIEAVGETDVALAPGIFQNDVEKAYEMRIILVDDRVFAFRIDSQSRPETKTDWRHDQTAPIFHLSTLDPAIEAMLRRFMSESGLRYGAIDAIVTPEGEFCFLECNPAGQWLWLEEFTGAPICAAVADALCAKG